MPVAARVLFDDRFLDELIAATTDRGIALTGEGGFLPKMIKAVLERGMQAEVAEHLSYDKHDPADQGHRELPQQDNTQDCRQGGRGCAAGPAPRSQREFHLGVGSQGSASTGWGGGHDHQPVCGRYDHPRHPAPPRRDAGDGVVPLDGQQGHRGRCRGGHLLAGPPLWNRSIRWSTSTRSW